MEQAIFAAGNFHQVQHYFDQIPGVKVTTAGYLGGTTENPTYEEVTSQLTGHTEAVHVQFDGSVVSFEQLCRHFFRIHDPTRLSEDDGDKNNHHRSEIYVVTDQQKQIAERIKREVASEYPEPIVTITEKAGPFYYADDSHQKYAERTGQDKCRVEYQPIS